MDINELAQIHEGDHPGYLLTDWYEAGFPSYKIMLRVMMQEKQELPVIDQFALRALEAKVLSVEEISNIYGLEFMITLDSLERLHKKGYITILRSVEEKGKCEILGLTKKGYNILQTMNYSFLEEDNFSFCVDALTGEYYPERHLFTPRNAKDADLFNFKPRIKVPEYDEIDIINLKRVWREVRRILPDQYQSKELIDVINIENWYQGFRSMRVLQYINLEVNTPIIHVYDGSDRSPGHEDALLKMEEEGIHSLRTERKHVMDRLDDPVVEILDPELYAAVTKKSIEVPYLLNEREKIKKQIEETRDIKRVSKEADDKRVIDVDVRDLQTEINRLTQKINDLESAAPTIRNLSMVEHRPILLKTIKEAKHRVVIISPWLSPYVINREFRNLIKKAVSRSVEIWIGYGFGEPDYREKQTLQTLEDIQQKAKGGKNLHLVRLEDTHAKVVICDERFMITTSFNWLSFGGDPERGNRVEFGTYIEDRKTIKDMLERLISLLNIPLNSPKG